MECFGIPIHAWTYGNLKRIGEQWGTLVDFDEHTKDYTAFTLAKILMDTCCFHYIKGSVSLVENEGYDVYVKEIRREINHSNKSKQQPEQKSVAVVSNSTPEGYKHHEQNPVNEVVGETSQSGNSINNRVDHVARRVEDNIVLKTGPDRPVRSVEPGTD